MMTGRFEFRDAYGRWVTVTPARPEVRGTVVPSVMFAVDGGGDVVVPRAILPEVLAAARELAADAGPDTVSAVSAGCPDTADMVSAGCPCRSGAVKGGCPDTVSVVSAGRTDTMSKCPDTVSMVSAACPEAESGVHWSLKDGLLVGVRDARTECRPVVVEPDPDRPRNGRRDHPGSELPGLCEGCGTGTYLMAGGAFAACARVAAGVTTPGRLWDRLRAEADAAGAAIPAQAAEPGEAP